MNKWLIFLCVILIFFSLVIIIINEIYKEDIKIEEKVKEQIEEEKNIIEYKANETIRVKFCKEDKIVAMDMNDYLRGVLASEMPGTYELEALKAQAVVARTYTYYRLSQNTGEESYDVTDSYKDCQAFYVKEKIFEIWENKGEDKNLIKEKWSKINIAVVSTQGDIITYNGEIIKAYFHASSPVRTENVDQIWGKQSLPYLVSVENFEEEDYSNRYSKLEFTYEEIEKIIKEKIDSNFKIKDKKDICINNYTTSSRVENVNFNSTIISAEKLRAILGLKSTLFTIDLTEDKIVFNVVGYGHGVGMSQVGANYFAKQGLDYIKIIKHYYTGVEITNLK